MQDIHELSSEPQVQSKEERRVQIMIMIGGILLIALLITAIVLMAKNPQAAGVVRDIAIVFVAVSTFLIGLVVIVLAIELWVLIKVLREELQPLLRSMNDTASTVRGTTEFVSENVVSPVIKVAGFTAAVRQVVRDLTGVIRAARPRRTTENQSQPQKEV
jgi:membrane protein implicated in regulation of membrane protease activity